MSDLREQILASLRPEDLDALSNEVFEALARRLAPHMGDSRQATPAGGWLDFDGALEHLGMKKGALYKLTAPGRSRSTRTAQVASSGSSAPSSMSGA